MFSYAEVLQRKIEKLQRMADNPAASTNERAKASARIVELTTELLAGRPIPC
jgi:hypothetical protein